MHPISAVQFEWSLLWREPEDDSVPAARRMGAGIAAYSPLGRGMLTATLTRGDIDGSDFRRSSAGQQCGLGMILLASSARPRAVVNVPYCLSPPKVLPFVICPNSQTHVPLTLACVQ